MLVPWRYATFDLDGTVLHDGALVPNLELGLAHLRSLGVRPVLVTGRGAVALSTAGRLPFEDILISSGNARLVGGKVMAVDPLPAEVVGACIDGVDAVVETTEALVATSRKAATAYAVSHGLARAKLLVDPGADGPGIPLVVTVFGESVADRLSGLDVELDRLTAYRADIVRPAGSCKALGVLRLLSHDDNNNDLAGVVAFGDAHSDACLLAAAGCGIAVAGADEVAGRHSAIRLLEPLVDYLLALDAGGPPREVKPPVCSGAHRHPDLVSNP